MARVDQFMSGPVVTVHIADNLNTAAAVMWDHDCGVVPVVDDGGRLVGILTDRDICMAAYTQGRRLHEIRVDAIMTRSVHACRPDDPVSRAEEAMASHQVRRIPVVDCDGRPVGLLSLNDLVRAAMRPSATQGPLLRGLARTLAAISLPRSTAVGTSPTPSVWDDYLQRATD